MRKRTIRLRAYGQALEYRDATRLIQDEGAVALRLVEISRISDGRRGKTDQRVDTFNEKLAALADEQLISEGKLAELVDRSNLFIAVVERYVSKGRNGSP